MTRLLILGQSFGYRESRIVIISTLLSDDALYQAISAERTAGSILRLTAEFLPCQANSADGNIWKKVSVSGVGGHKKVAKIVHCGPTNGYTLALFRRLRSNARPRLEVTGRFRMLQATAVRN